MRIFNCAVGDEIVIDGETILTVEEIKGDHVLFGLSGGEGFEATEHGSKIWVHERNGQLTGERESVPSCDVPRLPYAAVST